MSGIAPPLPARPKRPNQQVERTLSDNELTYGSEDGDTYEPPPTERPKISPVTIKPIGNNVYVGSTPVPPPPSQTRPPMPIPTEDADSAEYLEFDNIEGKGSKPIYGPRSLTTPPRGGILPPVGTPAVPVGKSIPGKLALPSEEVRRTPTMGISQGQTRFGLLVPTPFVQSGSFPRMQESYMGNASGSMASSSQGSGGENACLQAKPWFASKCDRKTAEAALFENGKDGAFLVRPSSRGNRNQPYTLAVLYQRKVFNIPIRSNEFRSHYILGKAKAGEKIFNNLPELIEYYQQKSLILINEQNQTKDATLLLYSVRP
ncbi:SH2 domain-containing protein 6-like [Mobula birostris]|uniref:SH2 domain-containing protein 6-like n=1 Tax=Mobula birostris TaxID=1983395 RepID=UPI003B27E34B